METQIGHPDNALSAESPVGRAQHGWEFFATVRALAAIARARADEAGLPPPQGVGRSTISAQDIVRFEQKPSLTFEASEVAEVREDETPAGTVAVVKQVFFGPFGPKGALPLHVTEHAIEAAYRSIPEAEHLEGHERTLLPDFLDLFTDRMTAFLYRAWETTQLAVNREQGDDDAYKAWLGALFGQGSGVFWDRDAMPDDHKRYVAGWLSNPRGSTASVEAVLGTLTGVDMTVQEFVPEWLPIAKEDQSRLGRAPARLGRDIVLGAEAYSVQTRFRVRTGQLTLKQYDSLLPVEGSHYWAARDAIRNLVGLARTWDLQLVLHSEEIPRLALSQDAPARLGWTSWLNSRFRIQDADDLVLEGT